MAFPLILIDPSDRLTSHLVRAVSHLIQHSQRYRRYGAYSLSNGDSMTFAQPVRRTSYWSLPCPPATLSFRANPKSHESTLTSLMTYPWQFHQQIVGAKQNVKEKEAPTRCQSRLYGKSKGNTQFLSHAQARQYI